MLNLSIQGHHIVYSCIMGHFIVKKIVMKMSTIQEMKQKRIPAHHVIHFAKNVKEKLIMIVLHVMMAFQS